MSRRAGSATVAPASSDPTRYNMKVNRNKPVLDTMSSYLPVVIWGTAGNEELCAAVDPRIVNVN